MKQVKPVVVDGKKHLVVHFGESADHAHVIAEPKNVMLYDMGMERSCKRFLVKLKEDVATLRHTSFRHRENDDLHNDVILSKSAPIGDIGHQGDLLAFKINTDTYEIRTQREMRQGAWRRVED